ncbi:sorbosone dehydrogenase family protein [Olivibacter sp. XZL3]|uniref:PQQ-dependent sugar dehydrogenase n=1 Tax=Olivibacter sp. XZL3 TaxID=1735116 RepID=UPI0010668686|nr:sorbosone dehydrogenase family protein [Olivibacter sp. XZL3]
MGNYKDKPLSYIGRLSITCLVIICCAACGGNNKGEKAVDGDGQTDESLGSSSEYGAEIKPSSPKEDQSTTKYAKIVGWEEGQTPTAPVGYRVVKFADSLNSPRNIYVAPNGDILVAQARTEREGEDPKKVDSRNIFRSKSPNQILLFRDKDGDGIPEFREVFLSGLSQPYGMLVLGSHFYVANTDGLVRFPYQLGANKIDGKGEKIATLPAGGYNNHWTRNILANGDGSKIYISVGSGSNVGDNGMEHEIRRANILEVNPDGKEERIYAAGLRNPVGMDWEPGTGKLWTAVNERDELGDELVPDYITHVEENGFYGWPYTYWGKHIDPRWKGKVPDSLVKAAITPDYAVGAHTASLGFAFNKAPGFNAGAFIGQHGSWNRSGFSGYKIVFVPFKKGKPAGNPEDFLTGFIADESTNTVHGRPVAVVFTKKYMLVADDAANVIWAILPE